MEQYIRQMMMLYIVVEKIEVDDNIFDAVQNAQNVILEDEVLEVEE